MLPGNVEVVYLVRQVIAVAEDAAARAYGEVKRQAALVLVRPRMHARLHHALAHRVGIKKLRQMPNRIVHPAPWPRPESLKEPRFFVLQLTTNNRSEERRVEKECRSRWPPN